MRRSTDALLGDTLLLMQPFVAYLVADAMGGSGVLAVVTVALLARTDRGAALDAGGRLRQQALWRLVGFVLTGVSFTLVGLQLRNIVSALADGPQAVPGGAVGTVRGAAGGRGHGRGRPDARGDRPGDAAAAAGAAGIAAHPSGDDTAGGPTARGR